MQADNTPETEDETRLWYQDGRFIGGAFKTGNWVGFINHRTIPRTFRTVLGFVVYAQALLRYFEKIELHVMYIGPEAPKPIVYNREDALCMFGTCPRCGFWDNSARSVSTKYAYLEYYFNHILPDINAQLSDDQVSYCYRNGKGQFKHAAPAFYVKAPAIRCDFCLYHAKPEEIQFNAESNHWYDYPLSNIEKQTINASFRGVPIQIEYPVFNADWVFHNCKHFFGYTGVPLKK